MKEYRIENFDRKTGDRLDADEKMVKALNDLAKEGWRVVQDLNAPPICHKMLLEREVAS